MKNIIKLFNLIYFFTVSFNLNSYDLEYDYCFEIKIKNVSEIETIYTDIVATVYNPEVHQTDSTPLYTADMSFIDTTKINDLRWVAISRDLLKYHGKKLQFHGEISYGDTIIIESPHEEINGWWVVHDIMNERYTNKIDFLQSKNGGMYNKWEDITIKKKLNKEIETKELAMYSKNTNQNANSLNLLNSFVKQHNLFVYT